MTSTIGDSITNSFGKDGRVMWSAEHSDPDYGTLPFEYLFDSPTKASEMLGVNPGEVVRVVILPYDKYAALAAAETRAGEAESKQWSQWINTGDKSMTERTREQTERILEIARGNTDIAREHISALAADLAAAKAEGSRCEAALRAENDTLKARLEELEKRASRKRCPCEFGNPCITDAPGCSCANKASIAGCRRCCRYGSAEQQADMAAIIIERESRLGRVEEAAKVLGHQARQYVMAIEREFGTQPKFGNGLVGQLWDAINKADQALQPGEGEKAVDPADAGDRGKGGGE